MKFPYAVRRVKNGTEYFAWSPFDAFIKGRGSSKVEALADLKRKFQEVMSKTEGEIDETDIEVHYLS